jgi:amino acid adenylation domain-containing protein
LHLGKEGWRATLFRTADREHTLLFNLNHMFGDGWSLGVWRRDFARFYEAFVAGKWPQLEDLPVQYSDFAAWERDWLNGDIASEQLQYWKKQLNGGRRTLALPTDRPRPPQLTYRGAVEEIRLSWDLIERLTALANRNRGTLFMALLAGWYVLLHRYSGQEEILTGSPIANRSKPEVQDLIGLFMNMIVLRGDLSGEPSFRELFSRVRQTTLEAYANQEYPLEKLVEQLKPERDLSRTPFYQNILILQTAATDSIHIPGLNVSWREVHTGTAKTDLTLVLEPSEGGLDGYLEYNTDLFEPVTIRRMLTHYEVLLRHAIADPDCAIGQLALLTPAEKQRTLVDWNQSAHHYPSVSSVSELLNRQAIVGPGRIAVVAGAGHLTYAELHSRANRLARYLQELGVGPEFLVGIHLSRSQNMLVALLAVMKAGGAYVPLDPAFPVERLAYIASDADLKIVITEQAMLDRASSLAPTKVVIDTAWEQIAKESDAPLKCPAEAANLMYILYTSGSTGKPKGVEISHAAILNFLYSMAEAPGISGNDRLLAVTTISFDIAGLELYLPLMVGARVVLATRDTALDGRELVRLMEQHQVTVMQATPATWQMILETGWKGRPDLKLLCGGEPLPPELAIELLPRCRELWNMYGPTETTIWSLAERITAAARPILIGRPIANTDVYILDKAGQPVPVGVSGELLIGGKGLARGYHNRPELTAEKFIAHLFSDSPGTRLYRTGDLARYHTDGRIECLGRWDFQVKLRGFRIEPGEIEALLAQRPEVARCVVVVREDRPGDKRLVAYVVLALNASFDPATVRQDLRQKLPDYMVPTAFVVMDELPLTPNRKVDRQALPAPASETAAADMDYAPPTNPYEETLCAIWAELLGVPRVGIHDNFFDLGGHSLLAVRVLARILERWPYHQLTIAIFLQAPTVAEFAAIIRSGKQVMTGCLVPFRKTGTHFPFFCIPGGGGNVVSLRGMADAFSSAQPFYCLQAKGLDGREPLRTVEEAAALYIEEIRHIQPHGPYYLGGTCFGGLVAFEMARILCEEGEEIGLLTLIDTYNFAFGNTLSKPRLLYENTRFLGSRIAYHVRKLKKVAWSDRAGYLSGRGKAMRYYLLDLLSVARGVSRAQLPIDGFPAQVGEHAGFMREALNRVTAASLEAARAYVPKYFPGEIVLCKASERAVEPYRDDTLGWRPFASHVEVIEIEAGHTNLLSKPRVNRIVERIETETAQSDLRESCESTLALQLTDA